MRSRWDWMKNTPEGRKSEQRFREEIRQSRQAKAAEDRIPIDGFWQKQIQRALSQAHILDDEEFGFIKNLSRKTAPATMTKKQKAWLAGISNKLR